MVHGIEILEIVDTLRSVAVGMGDEQRASDELAVHIRGEFVRELHDHATREDDLRDLRLGNRAAWEIIIDCAYDNISIRAQSVGVERLEIVRFGPVIGVDTSDIAAPSGLDGSTPSDSEPEVDIVTDDTDIEVGERTDDIAQDIDAGIWRAVVDKDKFDKTGMRDDKRLPEERHGATAD